jgi:hypothetical protein
MFARKFFLSLCLAYEPGTFAFLGKVTILWTHTVPFCSFCVFNIFKHFISLPFRSQADLKFSFKILTQFFKMKN